MLDTLYDSLESGYANFPKNKAVADKGKISSVDFVSFLMQKKQIVIKNTMFCKKRR
jgi:hypothetical protein